MNSAKMKRRIPPVHIQPQEHAADALVDVLAELWNMQVANDEAYAWFHESFPGDRGRMLSASLYRYPDLDREFLARQLIDLARSINLGLYRYLR